MAKLDELEPKEVELKKPEPKDNTEVKTDSQNFEAKRKRDAG